MTTFSVAVDDQGILQVGFGEPADNNQIVQDAKSGCEAVADKVSGKVLRVNGRASLPASFVIAHAFAHLVPAIAVFDPKLGKYVVAIAHGDQYKVGDLLD